MTQNRNLTPTVILVFLLLIVGSVTADVSVQAMIADQAMIAEQPMIGDQPMIGEMAPEFTLVSVAHGEISSADLRGNWTVVHIAASW